MNNPSPLLFNLNLPEAKNLVLGITTQAHGNMRLSSIKANLIASQNRQDFFDKFFPNFSPQGAIITHGSRVCYVTQALPKDFFCDGLLTNLSGVLLYLTVADCVPVFIYTKNASMGLLHVGWRGLASGIIKNAIDALRTNYHTPVQDFHFVLGPAICQPHYEVGEEMLCVFRDYPSGLQVLDNRLFLNLKKVISKQLEGLGVLATQVQDWGVCTYEHAELYSHRKQKNFPPNAQMVFLGRYL